MMFEGLLNLSWWGDLVALVVLTQITIAGVTLYLHRCEAHRALDLHPVVRHFFRLWMWLTTGMITKEWAAIHRKHHAKCETAEDPHSPQVYGIKRVLFGGVFLYVKESHHPETMQRYGHGTPDDWIERTHLHAAPQDGHPRDAPRGHRPLRRRAGPPHLRHPDGVDPLLGRRRHQRHRPLLGLPQVPDGGREHQHRPGRRVDRRRGAAQQPPRLPDLRQVLRPVVRVRPGLALHPGRCRPSASPARRSCPRG